MKLSKLKPCPFCGGSAKIHRSMEPEAKYVWCSECGTTSARYTFGESGSWAKAEEEADYFATLNWNRRVDNA